MSADTGIFFADMDGTTIYSKRHILGRSDGYAGLVVAETYRGEPLTFMTYEAVKALSSLSHKLTFVPTTTRDRAQFDRIRIPAVRSRYAIIANGGRIIVDGEEDLSWFARIQKTVRGSAHPSEVLAALQSVLKAESWVRSARSHSELFVSVDTKPGSATPRWFLDLASARASAWGYTISVQSRTTYLLPNGLTKERATAELAARSESSVTFAAGDSQLDLGMMRAATFPVRPAHGEPSEGGDDIPATQATGIDAGLEIVQYVSGRWAEHRARTA